MLTFTYSLSAFLMIIIPILLGIFLAQKYGLAWKLFLYGAAAFVLAQLVHIPLNLVLTRFVPALAPGSPEGNALAQAIVFGFTAAITEEPARYSVLKGKLKWARGWKEALMFGAGHGGLESIIFGISVLTTFISMTALRDNPAQLAQVPPEQLALIQQQMDAYWSVTWWQSLLPAVERFFVLFIQISLAVMVMQVFLRKDRRWLWAAIGWHWLVNVVSVWSLSQFQNFLITELIIGVFAFTSLMIILYFRPVSEEGEGPPSETKPQKPHSLDGMNFSPPTDRLDESRYRST